MLISSIGYFYLFYQYSWNLYDVAFGDNHTKTKIWYTVTSLWMLVSDSRSFVRLFAGVPGEGTSNDSGVVEWLG